MLRSEWKFQYNAQELKHSAGERAEIHLKKQSWWEDKKAGVMQKIKETGIEIQDSVAASYSVTKGSFGPQIKIDPGLQRDLTECQDKIMEHNKKAQSYLGWVQILSTRSDTYELDYDDWLYFFGSQ